MATQQTFTIDLAYHQFSIADSQIDPWESISSCWADEHERERRITAASGIVVVMTENPSLATIVLDAIAAGPPTDLEAWDYVAEASLSVPSGAIVVESYPPAVEMPPARLALSPGTYRVRVHHMYVRDPADQDQYRLVMWPAAPAPIQVLQPADGQPLRHGFTPRSG
jgi:hypothetical protein